MKAVFVWLEGMDEPYYEEVGEICLEGMEEDLSGKGKKSRKKPKKKGKGFKDLKTNKK